MYLNQQESDPTKLSCQLNESIPIQNAPEGGFGANSLHRSRYHHNLQNFDFLRHIQIEMDRYDYEYSMETY